MRIDIGNSGRTPGMHPAAVNRQDRRLNTAPSMSRHPIPAGPPQAPDGDLSDGSCLLATKGRARCGGAASLLQTLLGGSRCARAVRIEPDSRVPLRWLADAETALLHRPGPTHVEPGPNKRSDE